MSREKLGSKRKRGSKVVPFLGACRVVFVAGKRCIRINGRTGSGYADAEHRCEPRNNSA